MPTRSLLSPAACHLPAAAHWRYVVRWERLEGDVEPLGLLEVRPKKPQGKAAGAAAAAAAAGVEDGEEGGEALLSQAAGGGAAADDEAAPELLTVSSTA